MTEPDSTPVSTRTSPSIAKRSSLPVTGTLSRFEIEGGVRVDTGVESGSVISPHYDPMVAKVLAHGRTREEAAAGLADALARARVHGMTTNRDFLVNVLRHPEFLAGEADTGFLERHDCSAPLVADARPYAAAHALAGQAARRRDARVLGSLPSGWRNNRSQLQTAHYQDLTVAYGFDRGGRLVELLIDGEPVADPVVHACTPGRVDLEIDGVRRTYSVTGEYVNTAEGQAHLVELPRFTDPAAALAAGSLTSPMPGTVLRVSVEEGAEVEARQPLLVLEAMKMEHEITAPAAGRVTELRVTAGSQVEAGAVLAVIE